MLPEKLNIKKINPALNKQIVSFFIKLFILFSIWFVCYTLILAPGRIIDRPVTNFITSAVAKIINFLPPAKAIITWVEIPSASRAQLVQNGHSIFGIHDVCNGIDLMFIYAGIIWLLPYPIKRKLAFSIIGVIAIVFANIFRVCSLYFIYRYQRVAFEFSHHYLFTILMYVLIFYGWILFVKKGKPHEKSS